MMHGEMDNRVEKHDKLDFETRQTRFCNHLLPRPLDVKSVLRYR